MAFSHHLKHRHVTSATQRFDYVMDFVALASPLALLPQVWSIVSTHNVSGLSLPSWGTLFSLNLLWIAYGVSRRCTPIIVANSLFGILNFIGVCGILLYQ